MHIRIDMITHVGKMYIESPPYEIPKLSMLFWNSTKISDLLKSFLKCMRVRTKHAEKICVDLWG